MILFQNICLSLQCYRIEPRVFQSISVNSDPINSIQILIMVYINIIFKYSQLPYLERMNSEYSHTKNHRKERSGRWSSAETNLFEELIQRYGKNWKKIHQHMRGRTLSQIRSHAQKFFQRIGHKKTAQYQRRAKLLEALETLQKEKRLHQLSSQSPPPQELAASQPLKKQEEEPQPLLLPDQLTITTPDQLLHDRQPPENIKVQQGAQPMSGQRQDIVNNSYYQMPVSPSQYGYLMHLIYVNPDAFAQYGLGLEQWAVRDGLRREFGRPEEQN